MSTGIALFTRDLRVADNPMLAAALRDHDDIVPLFVLDDRVLARTWHAAPNRVQFLLESLRDLDASLRERRGALIVRRGDWTDELRHVVDEVGADTVHVAHDVSAYAQQRVDGLRASGVAVVTHPGVTVVEPGAITGGDGGEMKVFTPYYKRWSAIPWRDVVRAPRTITMCAGVDAHDSDIPERSELVDGAGSPVRPEGGETAGRKQFAQWKRAHLGEYAAIHDDLASDATSHTSAYLHFGCLSPLELATAARAHEGGEPFVRQLCWRDFYHQILAVRPDASRADYRDRGDHWRDDDGDFTAWCDGRTGFPVVDAAMRQLQREGYVHNRTRMVVASFLTKDLGIDWRRGADHFMRWLVDGDVANNQLNWQWVAGTGTDTNPHRVYNPTRQSERFDPKGEYIRRYVEELRDVPAPEIHDPGPLTRASCGYPAAMVDHHAAIERWKSARSR